MKNQLSITVSLVTAITILSGCTKDLPYKEQSKVDVVPKSAITSKEKLYSVSMQNASRTAADAFPFMFGDSKRVKLEWAKDSLRVLEVERDARYQGNKANNKLVLDIPVEYVDFQCTKDKYGECTNSEEVKDVSWEKKSKFKFKLEAAKSGELDLLPLLSSKTFGENCYEEVSARVLEAKIEATALNFDIERTYKTAPKCLREIESLSDASVTAVFHYSIVDVDSVTTPDFKTVQYPRTDENTFGFFSTRKLVLDADNNKTESGVSTIMNHWSPERTSIKYYLSDEFSKPENKNLKDLTFQTVEELNKGLRASGAKFVIELNEPANKIPGDIRNSMIVLVEDPVAASVIGYGPQTEDPVTGEIISARTVMFLGTIKKYVKYTYDKIVSEKKLNAAALAAPKQGAGQATQSSQLTLGKELQSLVSKNAFRARDLKSANTMTPIRNSVTGSVNKMPSKNDVFAATDIKAALAEMNNYTKQSNSEYPMDSVEGKIKYLNEVKNCAYGLGMDLGPTGVSHSLLSKFPGKLKSWDQLSEEEKQNAIDLILPSVWIPTLIHELGHNLGLRHNFQGSEDSENFYTDADLKQKGVDHKVLSSSVMEYIEDLFALPTLGKYDIAALRFAYAKEVETESGKLIPVTTTLADLQQMDPKVKLKDFGFCTDEHTGINPGCRRFDMGTTKVEIINNLIKDYQENYVRRSTRDGRLNFSIYDDATYALGVEARFMQMRGMQEAYERFKYLIPENNDLWKSHPMLVDIKEASLIAGKFLISVLTEPELSCLIARETAPESIIGLRSARSLSPDAISCKEIELNPGFIIVGETGRLLNSKKDPASGNAYMDQIDVRGYWMDKRAAANALFLRTIKNASYDKHGDNFTDRAELKEPLEKLVVGILTNEVYANQTVRLKNGTTEVRELPVDTFSAFLVDKLFDPSDSQENAIKDRVTIAKVLGVPNRNFYFSELLTNRITESMTAGVAYTQSGKSLADAVKVVRGNPAFNFVVPQGAKSIVLAGEQFIAAPANKVAFSLISRLLAIPALTKIDESRVVEILQSKVGALTPPLDLATLSEDEKAVMNLDEDTIVAFLKGELDEGILQNMLSVLAK